jgi:hypothetical protein
MNEVTKDVRDNWLLVKGSAAKDGQPIAPDLHLLVGVVPLEGGHRVQVPVDLTADEFANLAGNRLELGSFIPFADWYGIRERLADNLTRALDNAAAEQAE